MKARYCVKIYRGVGLNIPYEDTADFLVDLEHDEATKFHKKGQQKVRVYFAGLSVSFSAVPRFPLSPFSL